MWVRRWMGRFMCSHRPSIPLCQITCSGWYSARTRPARKHTRASASQCVFAHGARFPQFTWSAPLRSSELSVAQATHGHTVVSLPHTASLHLVSDLLFANTRIHAFSCIVRLCCICVLGLITYKLPYRVRISCPVNGSRRRR